MECARRQQREGVLRLRSHHEWFLEPRPEDWWHREELELKIINYKSGQGLMARKLTSTGLHCLTALPDHGENRTAEHV